MVRSRTRGCVPQTSITSKLMEPARSWAIRLSFKLCEMYFKETRTEPNRFGSDP